MIFIVSMDLKMASIDHVYPILSLDLIFRPTSNIHCTLCVYLRIGTCIVHRRSRSLDEGVSN